MLKLRDQKIVIIGGSSGIGLATARAALEEGAVVIIASRSKENLEKEYLYNREYTSGRRRSLIGLASKWA
ncbi:MAG: SDR family NAD(P)-dependent oxidoreductase [Deltaproteobacteria bacterium]|nr:SDR family NAD(P)-dependent oxidoreductase [Deltaproteobacteria bacterium]